MNIIYKISHQTLWQLLTKSITSVSTIIILVLVTRSFGPAGTGIFTLALTYITFFYLATDLGLNAHFMPELPKSDSNKIWQQILGMRILISIFLVLLALLITLVLPFNTAIFFQSVILGIGSVIFYGIYITAVAKFQSLLRYDYYFYTVSLSTLISFFIVLFLVFYHFPIPYLLLANPVGWAICLVLALIFIKRYYLNLAPIFDLKFIKTTAIIVWPISITLLLNMVYFRADSLILTSYFGFAQVGVYNLAYQVFQSALVVPAYITNSYYPVLLQELNQSKKIFWQNFEKVVLMLLILALLGILATYILSPILIELISGGQGFLGSIRSLQILSLGFPAFFISSVLFWLMVSLKLYKKILFIYLVGLILNILLNLIFIPKYSYLASSYVTGISEYLILILQVIILAFKFKG